MKIRLAAAGIFLFSYSAPAFCTNSQIGPMEESGLAAPGLAMPGLDRALPSLQTLQGGFLPGNLEAVPSVIRVAEDQALPKPAAAEKPSALVQAQSEDSSAGAASANGAAPDPSGDPTFDKAGAAPGNTGDAKNENPVYEMSIYGDGLMRPHAAEDTQVMVETLKEAGHKIIEVKVLAQNGHGTVLQTAIKYTPGFPVNDAVFAKAQANRVVIDGLWGGDSVAKIREFARQLIAADHYVLNVKITGVNGYGKILSAEIMHVSRQDYEAIMGKPTRPSPVSGRPLLSSEDFRKDNEIISAHPIIHSDGFAISYGNVADGQGPAHYVAPADVINLAKDGQIHSRTKQDSGYNWQGWYLEPVLAISMDEIRNSAGAQGKEVLTYEDFKDLMIMDGYGFLAGRTPEREKTTYNQIRSIGTLLGQFAPLEKEARWAIDAKTGEFLIYKPKKKS